MSVLLLSGDLMFASRIEGAAARLGTKLQTFSAPESLLEFLETTAEQSMLVLDLTLRGFDSAQWVSRFRQSAKPPRAIIAYGPHVHAAMLEAAKDAGCDEVFTRGQFNARMDEILATHSREQ